MIKLTKKDLYTLYKIIVDNSGGTIGIKDEALLESAININFTDEEIINIALKTADKSYNYDDILNILKDKI